MRHTVATAAATSLAVVSTLFSLLPAPQYTIPAALITFSIPNPAHAIIIEDVHLIVQEALEEPVVLPLAPEDVRLMIRAYASKYDVSEALMLSTVSCETAGTFDPTIRSRAIYSYSNPTTGIVAGTQEQSYGLAQIHLPANPDVTLEQAQDPDFALDFMASHLAKGEMWRWSCIPK